jgi:hypothetical protein
MRLWVSSPRVVQLLVVVGKLVWTGTVASDVEARYVWMEMEEVEERGDFEASEVQCEGMVFERCTRIVFIRSSGRLRW